MELIKGRWYKNLGERKNHIGKFDGWHSLNIISVSEYIYEGKLHGYSECFTGAYRFAKECSLSEIQQYLPDGHPDKEFVLPERWCVLRDTEEKGIILSKWANKDSGTDKHAGYGPANYIYSHNIDYSLFPRSGGKLVGYTEITFEQFKKYVLKQDNMDKEIIGYKLKEDCKQYLSAAEEIADYIPNRYNDLEYFLKKVNWGTMKASLEKAGVLDLWFEPIYKEVVPDIKEGDYIYLIELNIVGKKDYSRYNGDVLKVTSFGKEGDASYPDAYWLRHTPESFSGGGFRVDKSFWEYGVHFRKATPEEIKEAIKPKIEINGYKGEFFDSSVKFGCAEISKWIFIELNKCEALNHSHSYGNKEVESVTIGKGAFSKDQIKQIAEYYINKE